jgi:hypothetical protein
MAQFSLFENLNGILSLIKAELVDAPFCRSKTVPEIDLTGRVIFLTGATSGKPVTQNFVSDQVSEERPLDSLGYLELLSSSLLEMRRRGRNASQIS